MITRHVSVATDDLSRDPEAVCGAARPTFTTDDPRMSNCKACGGTADFSKPEVLPIQCGSRHPDHRDLRCDLPQWHLGSHQYAELVWPRKRNRITTKQR
jgi:hypothetical protein